MTMIYRNMFFIKLLLLIMKSVYAENADSINSLKFYQFKDFHKPKTMPVQKVVEIASLYDESRFKTILENILIQRDVGTSGHETVKNYIIDFLSNLNWKIELDEFHEYIPSRNKNMNFTTIIGRLNENAPRYLTLACHYDSKYMKNKKFVGATDSAVPCAMMLEIAYELNKHLKSIINQDLSLMLVFFDGEEAFSEWSATDSIYGARHLAKQWEHTPFSRDGANQLQRMDVMVLLDLLGARDPQFYYYDTDMRNLHYLLADIQDNLYRNNQLASYSPSRRYFTRERSYHQIEDDHIPFLRARTPVPILHIITEPFPRVWHTTADDYSALHFPTISNLNKIFSVFTISYLKGELDQDAVARHFTINSHIPEFMDEL